MVMRGVAGEEAVICSCRLSCAPLLSTDGCSLNILYLLHREGSCFRSAKQKRAMEQVAVWVYLLLIRVELEPGPGGWGEGSGGGDLMEGPVLGAEDHSQRRLSRDLRDERKKELAHWRNTRRAVITER